MAKTTLADDADALAEAEAAAGMDTVVGHLIRDLRAARKLSLKEVSARSGLSIGFLSQIERGISSPSLRVLASLANVFEVTIASLIPEADGSPGDPESPVLRASSRRMISLWRSGISKKVLTPASVGHKDLVAYMITIEPGGTTGDDAFTHDGEEAGVVMEGTLELQVRDQLYSLNEGDGFRFSSATPHRFFNSTNRVTRVIWVNYREQSI
jgi:transcriptional regulator with XRE-family HTH domain